MPKHYKFGGSTANRTMHCGAWIRLSTNMPKGPVSNAAVSGTVGHTMFESSMLDPEYEPEDQLGKTHHIEGVDITVDQKLIDKVYTAVEEMERILDDWDALDDYERTLVFDDDIGGTADVILMNQDTNLFGVGDLKTGDGYMVYAKNNAQLLFYAWLAVVFYAKNDLFKFDEDTEIVLFIIQPSDRRDDPYDEWVVTLKEVLDFGEAFKLAVRVAKSEQAEPTAGEWCAYCPAQATCPAKTGMIAASRRIPADSTELKSLISAMSMVDEVEAWCRSVRKVAHEQVATGVKLPGFKMVAKRATRQWNDPDEVEIKCKNANKLKAEDYYDQTLKSPAQLEKTCKALKVDFKKFGEYISLLSSGTTLVKEGDKRTEVLPLQALADMSASIKK